MDRRNILLLLMCKKMNSNARMFYYYQRRYRNLLTRIFFNIWAVNTRLFYLLLMRKQFTIESTRRVWRFPRPQYEFEENFFNEYIGHMYDVLEKTFPDVQKYIVIHREHM
jgi:hypothetical protein